MQVVTIRLPDPSALDRKERNALRTSTANAVREAAHHNDDVGVDIVPSGDDR